MKVFKIFLAVLFAFLPSPLKIYFLRAKGHRVGEGCKIGFSILDASEISLGDYVHIGSMNLVRGLQLCKLDSGSKIGNFNWIAGGGRGDFKLGRNSSVRRFHYFDASGCVSVGENTIVAGRGSLFFSHGLSPNDLNVVKSIEIEDWCYIGAASRFLPGSGVGVGTFVGMGAVVTKRHASSFVLLAGNPAAVRKDIAKDSIYFDRDFIRHNTHPEGYRGV